MADSMFHVAVEDGRGEYTGFVDDALRMCTIQVVMQLLMVAQGSASLNLDFMVYLLQVMVGVAVYWLVVRRLVAVRSGRARSKKMYP